MFYHSYGFALLSNCLLHMSCFTPGDHHPLCHRNNVHIPVLRLIVTRSGIPARPDKMTGQQPGSNKPCRTSQVAQAASNRRIAAPATRSAKHSDFYSGIQGREKVPGGASNGAMVDMQLGRRCLSAKISSLGIASPGHRHACP